MSTTSQINANQLNAQKSSGPVTPAGAERSSQNATKHGLTGQTLVISPEEREAYQAHVQSYMDHHKPATQRHPTRPALADSHWFVHQAFVLQTNAIALINAITKQMSEAGSDPIATAAAIAPATRQLNTYSIYEGRRRRAAKAILEELAAFEQELAEQQRATRISNKPNPQPEIGFVCSEPIPPMSPCASIRENPR